MWYRPVPSFPPGYSSIQCWMVVAEERLQDQVYHHFGKHTATWEIGHQKVVRDTVTRMKSVKPKAQMLSHTDPGIEYRK